MSKWSYTEGKSSVVGATIATLMRVMLPSLGSTWLMAYCWCENDCPEGDWIGMNQTLTESPSSDFCFTEGTYGVPNYFLSISVIVSANPCIYMIGLSWICKTMHCIARTITAGTLLCVPVMLSTDWVWIQHFKSTYCICTTGINSWLYQPSFNNMTFKRIQFQQNVGADHHFTMPFS